MARAKISIIAAIGPNRELGKDNKLLWHIPEDMARFKKLTQNHAVIMGRKTYESIGKPLPNRVNIVITKDIGKARYHFSPPPHPKGTQAIVSKKVSSLFSKEKILVILSNLIVCSSLEEAIKLAKKLITNNYSPITKNEVFVIGGGASSAKATEGQAEEIFIIGGGQIYNQAIKIADKLYLTLVEGHYEANTYFPDYSIFKRVVKKEKRTAGEYIYTFLEIEK